MSKNSEIDIQQLIDIIDRALTSQDERVINALRQLMMMVILTGGDTPAEKSNVPPGPLTEMRNDVIQLRKRMSEVEYELSRLRTNSQRPYTSDKFEWPAQNPTVWDLRSYSGPDYFASLPPATATSVADLQRKINSGKI